jgi:hypothetical protein
VVYFVLGCTLFHLLELLSDLRYLWRELEVVYFIQACPLFSLLELLSGFSSFLC